MARRKNVKRIDPRYFLHETVNRGETIDEAQEGIKNLVGAALVDSDLPADTPLSGYGIAGDRITLIPKDPKLYAQNYGSREFGENAHSQYIMIMPQDMQKVGLDLEGVVSELEGIMGLQQQRIHTGAGWGE